MSLDMQNLAELLDVIADLGTEASAWLGEKLDVEALAANAANLEGKSLTEIRGILGDDITDAIELLRQIYDGRTDNPHQVTKDQVGLGNVVDMGTASQEEAAAATIDDKRLTPRGLGAFWAEKVGAAPATLDTLYEIAAAFQNNPDVLTAIRGILDAQGVAIAALQVEHATQQALIDDNEAGLDDLLDALDAALQNIRNRA